MEFWLFCYRLKTMLRNEYKSWKFLVELEKSRHSYMKWPLQPYYYISIFVLMFV